MKRIAWEPEPNSGCWLWTGYTDKNGYGRIKAGDGPQWAHRVAYRLYKGPIPEGFEIDHTCSIPLCVNPQHLEAVTSAENQRRTFARGRGIRGGIRKTHCPQGHPLSGGNLYVSIAGKYRRRHCRTCRVMWTKEWRKQQRKETQDARNIR